MSSDSPKQRLILSGRKIRDAVRVMRDVIRQERKRDLYNPTFASLDEALEQATDGLIEISRLFDDVLNANHTSPHPTSQTEEMDLMALQESLSDMKAERDTLQLTVKETQEQLRKYADDLQKLYAAERAKRAELAEAYQRLQNADKLKTEFLTTINHELNSPLVPVDLQLQLLERGGISEEQRGSLQAAREGLNQYRRQLDGLIKYAALINQTHMVKPAQVNLKNLIDEVIQPLNRLAAGRGVKVTVRPIDENLTIQADSDLLGSLVYQLTHNAIKFNQAGGKVEIKVERDSSGVTLQFMDDGPGMPATVLERFGQDFNQTVEAVKRGVEGLGMGLALSNYVAGVHKGRLSAMNGNPRGVLVTLWLPEGE